MWITQPESIERIDMFLSHENALNVSSVIDELTLSTPSIPQIQSPQFLITFGNLIEARCEAYAKSVLNFTFYQQSQNNKSLQNSISFENKNITSIENDTGNNELRELILSIQEQLAKKEKAYIARVENTKTIQINKNQEEGFFSHSESSESSLVNTPKGTISTNRNRFNSTITNSSPTKRVENPIRPVVAAANAAFSRQSIMFQPDLRQEMLMQGKLIDELKLQVDSRNKLLADVTYGYMKDIQHWREIFNRKGRTSVSNTYEVNYFEPTVILDDRTREILNTKLADLREQCEIKLELLNARFKRFELQYKKLEEMFYLLKSQQDLNQIVKALFTVEQNPYKIWRAMQDIIGNEYFFRIFEMQRPEYGIRYREIDGYIANSKASSREFDHYKQNMKVQMDNLVAMSQTEIELVRKEITEKEREIEALKSNFGQDFERVREETIQQMHREFALKYPEYAAENEENSEDEDSEAVVEGGKDVRASLQSAQSIDRQSQASAKKSIEQTAKSTRVVVVESGVSAATIVNAAAEPTGAPSLSGIEINSQPLAQVIVVAQSKELPSEQEQQQQQQQPQQQQQQQKEVDYRLVLGFQKWMFAAKLLKIANSVKEGEINTTNPAQIQEILTKFVGSSSNSNVVFVSRPSFNQQLSENASIVIEKPPKIPIGTSTTQINVNHSKEFSASKSSMSSHMNGAGSPSTNVRDSTDKSKANSGDASKSGIGVAKSTVDSGQKKTKKLVQKVKLVRTFGLLRKGTGVQKASKWSDGNAEGMDENGDNQKTALRTSSIEQGLRKDDEIEELKARAEEVMYSLGVAENKASLLDKQLARVAAELQSQRDYNTSLKNEKRELQIKISLYVSTFAEITHALDSSNVKIDDFQDKDQKKAKALIKQIKNEGKVNQDKVKLTLDNHSLKSDAAQQILQGKTQEKGTVTKISGVQAQLAELEKDQKEIECLYEEGFLDNENAAVDPNARRIEFDESTFKRRHKEVQTDASLLMDLDAEQLAALNLLRSANAGECDAPNNNREDSNFSENNNENQTKKERRMYATKRVDENGLQRKEDGNEESGKRDGMKLNSSGEDLNGSMTSQNNLLLTPTKRDGIVWDRLFNDHATKKKREEELKAHLGNIESQHWEEILKILDVYSKRSSTDITNEDENNRFMKQGVLPIKYGPHIKKSIMESELKKRQMTNQSVDMQTSPSPKAVSKTVAPAAATTTAIITPEMNRNESLISVIPQLQTEGSEVNFLRLNRGGYRTHTSMGFSTGNKYKGTGGMGKDSSLEVFNKSNSKQKQMTQQQQTSPFQETNPSTSATKVPSIKTSTPFQYFSELFISKRISVDPPAKQQLQLQQQQRFNDFIHQYPQLDKPLTIFTTEKTDPGKSFHRNRSSSFNRTKFPSNAEMLREVVPKKNPQGIFPDLKIPEQLDSSASSHYSKMISMSEKKNRNRG